MLVPGVSPRSADCYWCQTTYQKATSVCKEFKNECACSDAMLTSENLKTMDHLMTNSIYVEEVICSQFFCT